MTDDATHIETCRVCGGNINVLHKPSWVQDETGAYRHNTPYCNPEPLSATERAAREWGRALVLNPQPGNGLESR